MNTTLSGLTQSRIIVCLYVCGRTYAILYFDPHVDLVPYAMKQNILGYRTLPVSPKEIELFIALNSFAGVVKTYKLTRVYFLFELVAVVS